MASVKRYTSEDYDLVCEFVKRASGIETVNEEIIAHSVLIKNDEEVTGMVSYEKFDGLGIIRYFIYNHQINPDLLVNMFFELYASAKAAGIIRILIAVSFTVTVSSAYVVFVSVFPIWYTTTIIIKVIATIIFVLFVISNTIPFADNSVWMIFLKLYI